MLVPVRHVEGVRRKKLASGPNGPTQGPCKTGIAKIGTRQDIMTSTSTSPYIHCLRVGVRILKIPVWLNIVGAQREAALGCEGWVRSLWPYEIDGRLMKTDKSTICFGIFPCLLRNAAGAVILGGICWALHASACGSFGDRSSQQTELSSTTISG